MIAVVSDWDQFLQEVSWFVRLEESVVVAQPGSWTRESVEGLPELSALLAAATLTPVSVGGVPYELLAWGSSDDRRGWLCHPPPRDVDGARVTGAHRRFWGVCGGIVERFGEPDTWWNNQNEVLTVEATGVRVADVLSDYAWLWEDNGLELAVEPEDYYVVAVEANGNLTLAHREDGRLLLFAPDHAFANVTPLAGSPPYSLLTIDHLHDLASWIEECAAAWR